MSNSKLVADGDSVRYMENTKNPKVTAPTVTISRSMAERISLVLTGNRRYESLLDRSLRDAIMMADEEAQVVSAHTQSQEDTSDQ